MIGFKEDFEKMSVEQLWEVGTKLERELKILKGDYESKLEQWKKVKARHIELTEGSTQSNSKKASQKDMIVSLLKQGKTTEEIKQLTGVTSDYIYQVKSKHSGVVGKTKSKHEQTVEKILSLVSTSKMGDKEIGEVLGVSKQYVNQIKNSHYLDDSGRVLLKDGEQVVAGKKIKVSRGIMYLEDSKGVVSKGQATLENYKELKDSLKKGE